MGSQSQAPLRNLPREGSLAQPQRNDIDVLHLELGHPLEVFTHATGRAMGLNLTGTFQPSEDYALVKAKKSAIRKKAIEQSKIFGERLFFDIS